jgi:phage-related protein
MAEVGSAFVSVLPSAKGFGRKLESDVGGELDKSGKRSGSRFGAALKLGIAGAVVGAGVAIGHFLKGAFDEARESQKVGALTNAVIKSTGGAANVTAKQVGKLSTALSNKTGIDDETIQSGENMLLTFKNVRNETGKGNDIFNQATKSLVDMSAAMGKDPKQAAIGLGKALNDPVKGVTALSRVGVTFTESQKKTIGSLVASGNKMKAQKIILHELNSEFGGAAAAQATAGDKAKVAWDNMKEAVGTALLPVLDKALTLFAKIVVSLTANVGPAFKALGTNLAPFIASVKTNFLPVLSAIGQTLTTQVIPAVTQVVRYFAANLMPIFIAVGRIIRTQVLPIVQSFALFFATKVYPAVIKIVRAIAVQLKPVFDQLFKTIRTSVLPAIRELLAAFRRAQPTIQKVILVIVKIIGFFLKMTATVLGKVLPPLIRLAGFLIRVAVKSFIAVVTVIVKVVKFLISLGRAVGKAIGWFIRFNNAIRDKVTGALRVVTGIGDKVKNALSGAGKWLYEAGKHIVTGLISGITSQITGLIHTMARIAKTVKDHLPGSPVKEGPLTAWNKNGGPGAAIVDRIAFGLSDTRPVEAAMSSLAGKVSLTASTPGRTAAAASHGVRGGTRLQLVVGDRVFDAYVRETANGQVNAHAQHVATRGRQG